MHSGKIVAVRTTIEGKRKVRKFGYYEQVDLGEVKAFARRLSAAHNTTVLVQAEPVMGYESYRLASFTDGRPSVD